MLRALVAALVLALMMATPTHASFEGTPGKIAFVDQTAGMDRPPLKLWDPVDIGTETIEAETVALPTQDALSIGVTSAPAWSPDGTRVAYVKSIDGTGDSPKTVFHTAVFVYDLRTETSTQLTHPYDTHVDPPGDNKVEGHAAADTSPAWSPDGETVAFIRDVAAALDDVHYGKRGANVWTVPAAGGTESQGTHYLPETFPRLTGGMVWIPGSTDVLVGMIVQSGAQLVRQGVNGGGATPVATTPTIADFDVSPDGKRFAYTGVGAGGIQAFEGELATGAAVSTDDQLGLLLRYSTTGTGLLRRGCVTREAEVCGVVERPRDDPEADIRGSDDDRLMLDFQPQNFLIPGSGGAPGRMAWDVQPQTLPVIFIPGFLGSEIKCQGSTLWPSLPFPPLDLMRLSADGLSSEACGGAGPSGNIVESVLGGASDVYGNAADHIREKYPNGRGHLFGWDWRKRPHESFSRLTSEIDAALEAEGPWKDQQAGRVVLWGHSYGGLLIRSFIDDDGRRRRVARVLTVGTPYRGSPKSIFPLAFGVEAPTLSALDALVNNDKLKLFARNLAGLYNLWPSDRYGTWLYLAGAAQNQAGVAGFITNAGGDAALFNQARGYHNTEYEGFFDDNGLVDTRIVAGRGLLTLDDVSLVDADDGGILAAGVFADGDETVPAASAMQKGLGETKPFGDPVHIQSTCRVSHVPLGGDGTVISAYEDFVDRGAVPRKLSTAPCTLRGEVWRFRAERIGLAPTKGAARAGTPMALQAAEQQGLVDLIDTPDTVLAVTNAARPVTLQVPIVNDTFSYTPYVGETPGATLTYGPVTGLLQLAQGAAGGPPAVTLNGAPLAPNGGGGGPTGGGGPAGGGGATPPAGGGGGGAATPKKLAFVKLPRLRGRKLTLTVRAPRAGTLRVTVTARGKRLGTARAKLRRAGRKALTVRFKRRPKGKLKVVVSFKPRTGAAQRLRASLRAR